MKFRHTIFLLKHIVNERISSEQFFITTFFFVWSIPKVDTPVHLPDQYHHVILEVVRQIWAMGSRYIFTLSTKEK